MNELIRDFADRACEYADYDPGHIPNEFLKKFTELVVEECADQIIQRGRDWVDFAPSKTAIRPEYWDMAQHIKKYWS